MLVALPALGQGVRRGRIYLALVGCDRHCDLFAGQASDRRRGAARGRTADRRHLAGRCGVARERQAPSCRRWRRSPAFALTSFAAKIHRWNLSTISSSLAARTSEHRTGSGASLCCATGSGARCSPKAHGWLDAEIDTSTWRRRRAAAGNSARSRRPQGSVERDLSLPPRTLAAARGIARRWRPELGAPTRPRASLLCSQRTGDEQAFAARVDRLCVTGGSHRARRLSQGVRGVSGTGDCSAAHARASARRCSRRSKRSRATTRTRSIISTRPPGIRWSSNACSPARRSRRSLGLRERRNADLDCDAARSCRRTPRGGPNPPKSCARIRSRTSCKARMLGASCFATSAQARIARSASFRLWWCDAQHRGKAARALAAILLSKSLLGLLQFPSPG